MWQMGHITGTGCQFSAMLAAFLAANPEEPLKAAAAAVCMMGLAGELAGSGIAGVAVISAIFAQKDIEAAAKKLCLSTRQLLDSHL